MDTAKGRIKQCYPELRPSERRVADYVLLHPDRVGELTLAALAGEAGVSEPTVLRLVHALGYHGLGELRLALARESGGPRVDLRVAPGDRLSELPDRLIGQAVAALEDTRATLDRERFSQAVALLASARHIDVYGVGNSEAVAVDLVTKLLRIGLPCRFYADSHLQQIAACGLGPGDAAVGISHSGATRDTVDALRIAREQGAATIAITNFRGAHVLEWADVALVTGDVETGFDTETMASRISQLAIVDSLYMGLVLQDYEGRAAFLEKVNRMVSRKVY